MDNQKLRQLRLRNFRSHQNLELSFNSDFTFFTGPNGAGKTNILEAISLFSPGRGLRGANIHDFKLLNSIGNWELSSVFEISNEILEIEIGLEENQRKVARVDGKKKPLIHLGNLIKIIWLTPLMDRLWIDNSMERRKFLDRMVMNFFPEHAQNCIIFDKVLRQRNKLFKENCTDFDWFISIEKQLAEYGCRIDVNRRKVIDMLLESQSFVGKGAFLPKIDICLTQPKIANTETFLEDVIAGRTQDRIAGRTLKGPHRSDLIVKHGSKNMEARYCSTGEQKSLLFSLFLSNALAIRRKFGKPPIILLDEVVAHLDQETIFSLFNQLEIINAQTFATGTEKSTFERIGLKSFSNNLILGKDIKLCL